MISKISALPMVLKLRTINYISINNISQDEMYNILTNIDLMGIAKFALVVGGVILAWKIASKIIKILVILAVAALIFSYFL